MNARSLSPCLARSYTRPGPATEIWWWAFQGKGACFWVPNDDNTADPVSPWPLDRPVRVRLALHVCTCVFLALSHWGPSVRPD